MSSDVALIEEIVSRVLRELGTASVAARPSMTAPAAPHAASPETSISAHVVTSEILEGLAGNVRTIRVGPKAILTPSARDFIRQQGLTVLREVKVATKSAAARWLVIVSHASLQVTGALDALRTAGAAFESRLSGTAQEAASLATGALCRGEAAGVVVLSDQPELVACLANRNEKIRAAALSSASVLDRLSGSLQPNLLAVDSRNKNAFELRQLLKSIIGTMPKT